MTWLADFFGAQYVRAIAAAVVVALIAWLGWTVNGWRIDAGRLEATEKALETRTAEAEQCAAREQIAAEAYAEAAGKAVDAMNRDRETAQRVERELQDKLAAADGRARDLARRLLDYTRAGASGRPVPAASGPAGQPAAAGGEPAGADPVGEATEALIGACERDSVRLSGWQDWWGQVSSAR